jgi:capsular exopolysaccharide synthesis family protein
VLTVLRKQWRVSAMVAGAIVLLVTTVTLLMRPVYEPEAKVEVDPPGAELFKLEGPGTGNNDADYLETQAQNLQGQQLALAVIRKLRLDQNPDIVSAKSLKNVAAGEQDSQRLTPAEYAAVRTFNARLKVKREPASRLITVSFGSHDPQLAATVTNTLVNVYIDESFETRHAAILKSSQWLTKQLDDIRVKMEDSNRVLADFQKQYGIVDESNSAASEQMTELTKQLSQAQADRMQLQSFLSKVRAGEPDSLPQITANPVIEALTEKLAETRADLQQVLAVYGANHPNARRLQRQADELQVQIARQRNNILGDLRTSYSAAQGHESLLNRQLQDATREMSLIAQYSALKKDADANSLLYNGLVSKVKEAGIAAASKSSNVRLVDEARILDRPTRPRRLLNISIGLLVALVLGVVVAFAREGIDTTIRTPEDVRACLGLASISVVPVISDGLLSRHRRKLEVAQKFLLDRPHSPEAEAVLGIHTSVRLSSAGRPPQVLLIASPFAGEGKTTLAVNLAIALARHARTCLVDADMRKTGVAGAFGVAGDKGLGDVLSGRTPLEDVLLQVPDMENLTLLPAGHASGNPAQLLCSEAIKNVVRSLRQTFEFVVVDTAPIIPFADGRAISPLVDGVVLVSRAGVTTKDALARAVELLQEVRSAPVMDVVLNAAEYQTSDYRYYGYETAKAA